MALRRRVVDQQPSVAGVHITPLAKYRVSNYYALPGCPQSLSPVYYFNNDVHTFIYALRTRVLGCFIDGHFAGHLDRNPVRYNAFAIGKFGRKLFAAASLAVPLSLEQSCARFTGARSRVYRKALEEFNHKGVAGVDYPGKLDFALSDFVKDEPQMKPDANPRMIRGRSPIMNIIFGTIIFAITPIVKDTINRHFIREYDFPSPILVCGENRDALAAHLGHAAETIQSRCNEPISYVRIDGKRYDFHVSASAIDFTQKVYSKVNTPLKRILDAFYRYRLGPELNRGRTVDALITFRTKPQRDSGDDDTFLGNCIIACKMIDEMCSLLRVQGCRYMYASDNSDDIGFMLPTRYVSTLRHIISDVAMRHGFRFEVEVVSQDYRRYSWMQSHLIYDSGRYRLIRILRRALRRDFMSSKPLRDEQYYYSWLAAVGLGGVITFGDVPILGRMYWCMFRCSRGAKPISLEDDYWWGVEAYSEIKQYAISIQRSRVAAFERQLTRVQTNFLREPSINLRCAIAELENLNHDDQIAWENHFDRLSLDWSEPCTTCSPDGPLLW